MDVDAAGAEEEMRRICVDEDAEGQREDIKICEQLDIVHHCTILGMGAPAAVVVLLFMLVSRKGDPRPSQRGVDKNE